ncbi:hypothetical protein [Ruminiclostridium cellobioparum]|uniref:hypothetical protein n=1 Tax=Ruminiclostridium cellobioparum TaxID=29355 RepID=UPI0004856E7C|nr:hypothetical protein [Ruminiclostridium cellobioparum]
MIKHLFLNLSKKMGFLLNGLRSRIDGREFSESQYYPNRRIKSETIYKYDKELKRYIFLKETDYTESGNIARCDEVIKHGEGTKTIKTTKFIYVVPQSMFCSEIFVRNGCINASKSELLVFDLGLGKYTSKASSTFLSYTGKLDGELKIFGHSNNLLFDGSIRNGVPFGYGVQYDSSGNILYQGAFGGGFVQEDPIISGMASITSEFEGLKKRFDVMENQISSINADIQNLRSQFSETMENMALKDEIINKLVNLTQNNAFQLMQDSFDKNIFMEADLFLRDLFGEAWYKLEEDSKKFLYSSEYLFKTYGEKVNDQFDYSPLCIPITKALEVELRKYIFEPMLKYCVEKYGDWKNNRTNLDKYPDQIRHCMNTREINFTLGKVYHLLEDNECKKIFKSFALNNFKPGILESEEDIQGFQKECTKITNKYRNKVAHGNGISLATAKECREYVITVRMFFVEFMKCIK